MPSGTAGGVTILDRLGTPAAVFLKGAAIAFAWTVVGLMAWNEPFSRVSSVRSQ